MGANSNQAQAIILFLVAFVCIAGGLAADINYLLLLVGLVLLAGSVAVFMKAKGLERNEG
jgi:hypothetical protein